jgi:SpoVK/Ycf46/Vps4 family AAA+-type ATPase
METWLENNNRYLAASLAWLRLQLERLALQDSAEPPSSEAPPAIVDEPAARQRRFAKWVQKTPDVKEPVKLLTAGTPPTIEELLEEATTKREAAAQTDPPPALQLLANNFGLSPFERDTLLLCASLEFDPGFALLCGLAQQNPAQSYPTFSLALSIFDEPRWDVTSSQRPLRYARLIGVNQPGPTPLTSAALRADERIVNYIKGLNALDDSLATIFQPVANDEALSLAPSQQAAVAEIIHRLAVSSPDSITPFQLIGTDNGSRLAVARTVCEATGRRLLRVGADALPVNLAEIETLARLWQRETVLLPIALYIDADNLSDASGDALTAIKKFLSRPMGLIFVAVHETPLTFSNEPTFAVQVKKPTPIEQCEAWRDELESIAPDSHMPQILAGQFSLNLGEIRSVAASVDANHEQTVDQQLWQTCRDLTRVSLDSLAQRLEPKATWDDLVLPDEPMGLMRQIASQIRDRHKVYDEWGFARTMNRGFGISALFSGESGTGKTMAAEVIANDLQLNLYRIDLSAVVSKYIGETEKNLRRLFDAAERGGAILFFDEADALFGKRSEVKDSHDRYANIEINYLLQRMEAFSGLAILATNMKSALDTAFARRLRFVVNLPYPGIKERKLIWQRALPVETPTKDLDFERLARLSLSGGNIQSIALNAAFMAASNGQTVTMPILMSAARAELRKLDRGFSEGELRLIGAPPKV